MREAGDYRVTLLENSLVRVEDVSMLPADRSPVCGEETEYRLVLPYLGMFRYEVRNSGWLLDSNSCLWTAPGWRFALEHPVEGVGHAAIVVTPARELLKEICLPAPGARGFARLVGRRGAPMRLQYMVHQLLHSSSLAADPIAAAELIVQLIETVVAEPLNHTARCSKIVHRAKEVLHERSCERLSLGDLAQEVGVSPVYLTQQFTKIEGMPLYRYALQLRLSRSLVELPYRDDITGLALDLGFSSHSHFTSVFRRIFGITPSEFRASFRKRKFS